ncbi:maltotransferase domain-containing protein, partial [Streptomyces sp. NPDC059627]
MPATHHSSAPPTRRTSPGAPPPADEATAVGRIPVLDVRPLIQQGRRPAKAVTGESLEVTAPRVGAGADAHAPPAVHYYPPSPPRARAPRR